MAPSLRLTRHVPGGPVQGCPWRDAPWAPLTVRDMDTWTPADASWLRPVEAEHLANTHAELGIARSRPLGLASFAEDCLTLGMQLDREFAPLHRIGEELLARLGEQR